MINIGEQLHNARTAKQLSIEEAAAQTKVSATVLNKYENNDFGAQPLTVYTKGHVKLYCQILGLDPTTIVDALQQQYAEQSTDPMNHEPQNNATRLAAWLLFFKKRLNFTHVALLLLLGGWVTFIVYASHSNQGHILQTTPQPASEQASSSLPKPAEIHQVVTLHSIKQPIPAPVPAPSKTLNETSND